ncbi:N-acetylglucosamine-6-sulfatase isoform X2 [Cephus cinctus]|nr:N-acetylglucosamine-6-sulfatase isoform X2 [Cephus cinctus]
MGYTTFYAGKYMNQYGVNRDFSVPPGWDWWAALVGNSKYYNYSLSINGTQYAFRDRDTDYLTDSISRMAANFIKTRRSDENPFLMVLAPPAPHAPFTPATRHNDRYKDTKAKKTGNFNTPMQKDKHWLIRMGPSPLPESILPRLDEVYRRRFETLLAVDELVLNVHKSLTNANLLNNTYIIFTSDNGYHIGQFSMSIDKRQPYETDIRVPLMIRGPGISPKTVIAPVSSVDLYATILMIAGIEAPSDGTSLIDTLPLDRTLLIEYRGEHSVGLPSSGCPTDADPNLQSCSKFYGCKCQDVANNTYACIRRVSKKYNNVFCVFEDDEAYIEAYDLNSDVDQLNNIGKTMKRGKRYKFRRRLKNMSICQNSGCMR